MDDKVPLKDDDPVQSDGLDIVACPLPADSLASDTEALFDVSQ